ncbi:hypothetical protein GCM10009733_008770 [Nonomuraea maheshkhaliensis]|uniref:MmcQ/YjbR family DNA-binding protein n=1 Tax=Nonomuraea maheshkhaliensis TaxID=419590 RepID=A0ABP4QMQ3_9ACTN
MPPLDELERRDESVVFGWISRHFPAHGSKIAWGRVEGRHAHWRIADDQRPAARAAAEVRRRLRPGSVVEHVGDSLSPYGVCFTDENALAVLAALLEIPEHHYFLAEDRSWIVVVTMEGDLDALDRPR